MKLRIVMIIVLLSSFAGMRAQNDPVLAGMIALYTEKAEKELKNQEQVMLLMIGNHVRKDTLIGQIITDGQRHPYSIR